jgi:hypothetical protein
VVSKDFDFQSINYEKGLLFLKRGTCNYAGPSFQSSVLCHGSMVLERRIIFKILPTMFYEVSGDSIGFQINTKIRTLQGTIKDNVFFSG